MGTSTVFGIRHAADIEADNADWLIDSVNLINAETAKTGEVFLFDTIDVTQRVLNGHKCWDMYGWVVPLEKLPKVEPLWLADDDALIDGCYVFVGFEEGVDAPVVNIDRE